MAIVYIHRAQLFGFAMLYIRGRHVNLQGVQSWSMPGMHLVSASLSALNKWCFVLLILLFPSLMGVYSFGSSVVLANQSTFMCIGEGLLQVWNHPKT